MLVKLTSLSGVAGLLFLIGFAPYIRGIIKGSTKPAKASWIIWASLDLILVAGMLTKHALNGQIVGALIGATTVAMLSLKYGKPGWELIDKTCLGGMILGLVCWWSFNSPLTGIVICSILAIVGGIPTVTAAWKDVGRENRFGWTCWWLSCLCALIAIPRWTIADAAQPLSFTLTETVMMYILFVRAASPKLERA